MTEQLYEHAHLKKKKKKRKKCAAAFGSAVALILPSYL